MTVNVKSGSPRADPIPVDERSPMHSLPYWARATNPIVRRHLGLYWRTLPPEFEPIFLYNRLLDRRFAYRHLLPPSSPTWRRLSSSSRFW